MHAHATPSVPPAKDTDLQLDNQKSFGIDNFKLNFNGISMLHEESFANAKVPHATAEGIWNKAVMLIKEENTIVVASGCGPKINWYIQFWNCTTSGYTTSGNFE